MPDLLWPFLVYALSVLVVVAVMLSLSWVLGQRHHDRATGQPFEGGIASYGSARLRFSAKFYIVALLFLVFDLEAVFLYAWAISLRDAGWTGYAGAMFFIGILTAVLVYEWRMGALDWSKRRVPADQRDPRRALSASQGAGNATSMVEKR